MGVAGLSVTHKERFHDHTDEGNGRTGRKRGGKGEERTASE